MLFNTELISTLKTYRTVKSRRMTGNSKRERNSETISFSQTLEIEEAKVHVWSPSHHPVLSHELFTERLNGEMAGVTAHSSVRRGGDAWTE